MVDEGRDPRRLAEGFLYSILSHILEVASRLQHTPGLPVDRDPVGKNIAPNGRARHRTARLQGQRLRISLSPSDARIVGLLLARMVEHGRVQVGGHNERFSWQGCGERHRSGAGCHLMHGLWRKRRRS